MCICESFLFPKVVSGEVREMRELGRDIYMYAYGRRATNNFLLPLVVNRSLQFPELTARGKDCR